MLLAFFDSKGYSHIVPRGFTINLVYILKFLGIFTKHMKKKRPILVGRSWFFHWYNTPFHTAAIIQDGLTAHSVQVLCHPPYSLDLMPADFFLFWCVNDNMAGVSLDQNTLKIEGEGVRRKITTEEFSPTFKQWYERCQKCTEIGCGYVEKKLKNK